MGTTSIDLATLVLVDATQVVIPIPANCSSGFPSVTNANGTATSTTQFTYVQAAVPTSLHARFVNPSGGTSGTPLFEMQEAEIIQHNGVLRVYGSVQLGQNRPANTDVSTYGGGDTTKPLIGYYESISGSMAGPWRDMVYCFGQGQGGISRNACGSYMIKEAGYLYCMYTDGYASGTHNIYLARTVLGQNTWEDMGLLLQPSDALDLGFGNSSVYKDVVSGKFIYLIESIGSQNTWRIKRYTSNSITEKPVLDRQLDELNVEGNMYGGGSPWQDPATGKVHTLYHYGSGTGGEGFGGSLPTWIGYAAGNDSQSLAIVEAPVRRVEDTPFGAGTSIEVGTTQSADPNWQEITVNGQPRVVFVWSNVKNGTPTLGQIRYLEYAGSHHDLVTGIKSYQPTVDDLKYVHYRTLVGLRYRDESRLLHDYTDAGSYGTSYGIGDTVYPFISNPPAGKTKLVISADYQMPASAGSGLALFGISPAGLTSVNATDIKWAWRGHPGGGLYPHESGVQKADNGVDVDQTYVKHRLSIEIPLNTKLPAYYHNGDFIRTSSVAVTTDLEAAVTLRGRGRLYNFKVDWQ